MLRDSLKVGSVKRNVATREWIIWKRLYSRNTVMNLYFFQNISSAEFCVARSQIAAPWKIPPREMQRQDNFVSKRETVYLSEMANFTARIYSINFIKSTLPLSRLDTITNSLSTILPFIKFCEATHRNTSNNLFTLWYNK